MNILLLDDLDKTLLTKLLSDNVFYRPDLLEKNPSVLVRTLISSGIDAVISSANLSKETLEEWFATRVTTYYVNVKIGKTYPPSIQNISVEKTRDFSDHLFLNAYGENELAAYTRAFELLEQSFTLHMFGHTAISPNTYFKDNKRVLIVGAGIVNLITAHTLQGSGYEINIIDRGADPREKAKWISYGCSRGGDDARMFSMSEMNNYNDKQITKTKNKLFIERVIESGWVVHREGTLSNKEMKWIQDFECLPTWLASKYNEDIFDFNRESHLLWENWKGADPELFGASFLREGIVRLFSDPITFNNKAALQKRLGAIKRLLSPEDIASEHPGLADAVNDGLIAGGIDEVGFTIRLHEFMNQLLERLERAGAKFTWNESANNLIFDQNGNVKGVQLNTTFIEADHYVISPGAYGNELLNGTGSYHKIHGVLGVWLRLPNINPQLTHSLKIRRTGHITEAANITISMDAQGLPILILGSGYGYTGVDPHNIDHELLEHIYIGLIDTAKKYFPKPYQATMDSGGIENTLKYCVRPWTAMGLGIFEVLQTDKGGKCIITGGHNTGGFAQSPLIAQSVLAALQCKVHKMHYLYHPKRASTFLSTNSVFTGI